MSASVVCAFWKARVVRAATASRLSGIHRRFTRDPAALSDSYAFSEILTKADGTFCWRGSNNRMGRRCISWQKVTSLMKLNFKIRVVGGNIQEFSNGMEESLRKNAVNIQCVSTAVTRGTRRNLQGSSLEATWRSARPRCELPSCQWTGRFWISYRNWIG